MIRRPPRSTLFPHDALPISSCKTRLTAAGAGDFSADNPSGRNLHFGIREHAMAAVLNGLSLSRSEEHTSELQSLAYLVCRLLLEKKKNPLTPNAFVRTETVK